MTTATTATTTATYPMSIETKSQMIADIIKRELCVTVKGVNHEDSGKFTIVTVEVSRFSVFGSYSLHCATNAISRWLGQEISCIMVRYNSTRECFEMIVYITN
jgi:hypothetical protein